jgi:hypothetical protein
VEIVGSGLRQATTLKVGDKRVISVREGGMNVLRPYSFGTPSEFSSRAHLPLRSIAFALEPET